MICNPAWKHESLFFLSLVKKKFSSSCPFLVSHFPSAQVNPTLTSAAATCGTRLLRADLIFFWVLNISKRSLGIFFFFPSVQASLRIYVTSHCHPSFAAIHLQERSTSPEAWEIPVTACLWGLTEFQEILGSFYFSEAAESQIHHRGGAKHSQGAANFLFFLCVCVVTESHNIGVLIKT